MSRRLGVCSWSLRPDSPTQLVDRVAAAGLNCVQLALGPLRVGAWKLGRTLDSLRSADVAVASGMLSFEGEDYSTLESIRETGGVRSDELWRKNRKIAGKSARLARELKLELVSFHAGFLPEDRDDPLRATLIERLREVIDEFAAYDIRTALETGQETADTLLGVLADLDRDSVGVNFDPANMILYGMGEPVAALERLAPHVFQVHIKDAKPTTVPGTWGQEVPTGYGKVDWTAFFDVLERDCPDVDLMIEREAGPDRVDDIRTAAALVREELQRLSGGA